MTQPCRNPKDSITLKYVSMVTPPSPFGVQQCGNPGQAMAIQSVSFGYRLDISKDIVSFQAKKIYNGYHFFWTLFSTDPSN